MHLSYKRNNAQQRNKHWKECVHEVSMAFQNYIFWLLHNTNTYSM